MCVFNPELDAQHIMLLEFGREAIRTIENSPLSCEPLLVLLWDIAAVTRYHHEMEEAVLKANSCPTLPDIAVAHRAAQAKLDKMVSNVVHKSGDLAVFGSQVSEWMHTHIYETDLPVRDFLRFPG